jgi:hypothetical protein
MLLMELHGSVSFTVTGVAATSNLQLYTTVPSTGQTSPTINLTAPGTLSL